MVRFEDFLSESWLKSYSRRLLRTMGRFTIRWI